MSKHKRKNISNCNGWGYPAHPTERKLTSVRAYPKTEDEIELALCPDCLRDFNESRPLQLDEEYDGQSG